MVDVAVLSLIDYRAPLDLQLFHAINHLQAPWLDALSVALSSQIFLWLTAGVVCVSLWIRQRRRALPTLLTAVVAVALTDWIGFAVLKPLFARERPCYALPAGTFRQLVHIGHGGSLPSLHAANAFAFAFAISLGRPRWAPYLYFLATLIALSRVHLGVHWPSDLIGGAIWGTLVALLTHGLIRLAVLRRAQG